jgi:glutaredoxin-like protein
MSTLISEEDKKVILESYWNNLKDPVKFIYFTSEDPECKYCSTIEQLYKELTELSDKLSLEIHIYEKEKELAKKYNISNAPVVVLEGRNNGYIKFYGIPSGMEFPSFIDVVVKVSRGETELKTELINKLMEKVDAKVNIKVFVTPTCPYCPKMVSTAFQFAILSDNIEAEAWEAVEFPSESKSYDVMAVPKTIINDTLTFEGLVTPEYLLHYILHALGKIEDHAH